MSKGFFDCCKGCNRREVGCHEYCQDYSDGKNNYDKLKTRIKKKSDEENDVFAFRSSLDKHSKNKSGKMRYGHQR